MFDIFIRNAKTTHAARIDAGVVRLFEHSPELTRQGANMVFAGEADDPATVEALTRMGYTRASEIIGLVRGWHHGRYPAVHRRLGGLFARLRGREHPEPASLQDGEGALRGVDG